MKRRFTPADAEVFVYSFKDGLLSAVAHDLKLAVRQFWVEVDEAHVRAEFDARSLRVVTTRKDGRDSSGLLPTAMYGEIESNIVKDVLHAPRFPAISFQGEATPTEVSGTLTLCGQARKLTCTRRDEGSTLVARVTFDQRDFGIKPYTAMLGTLKIKPHVDVEVRLRG